MLNIAEIHEIGLFTLKTNGLYQHSMHVHCVWRWRNPPVPCPRFLSRALGGTLQSLDPYHPPEDPRCLAGAFRANGLALGKTEWECCVPQV